MLKTKVIYSDVDFAVIEGRGSQWILHDYQTYQGHALENQLAGIKRRGIRIEIRLHGCDPDAAVKAARKLGFEVLVDAEDKPYELREAQLVYADGYVWCLMCRQNPKQIRRNRHVANWR